MFNGHFYFLWLTVPLFFPCHYDACTLKCYNMFINILQRERSVPRLSFDESEGRALLLKEWSRYKQVITYHPQLQHLSFYGKCCFWPLYSILYSSWAPFDGLISLLFLQKQHMAEVQSVELAVEAQREALEELKMESEELYKAALKPDLLVFPFTHEGPTYTPPKTKYDAPDGKYIDITKVYTQWWTGSCGCSLCVYCCLFVDSTSQDAAWEQPAGVKKTFHINLFLELSTIIWGSFQFFRLCQVQEFPWWLIFPHSCLCMESNLKEIQY